MLTYGYYISPRSPRILRVGFALSVSLVVINIPILIILLGNKFRPVLFALVVYLADGKNRWYTVDSCEDILPGSWHRLPPWHLHLRWGPNFPVPQGSPTKKTRGRRSGPSNYLPQFNGERTSRRSNWTIK